jgi:itaconate CoA-transferase
MRPFVSPDREPPDMTEHAHHRPAPAAPLPLPLAGVTVVSLEQAVAAPFATRQLADLGARVIKVERPDGGDFARRYDQTVHGQSSYFVWLNRSKQSLTLDVKTPDGRAVLDELLTGADVLVHNLGPGAAARLGIDPASLADRHPRVIPCTISGYGTDGPWADRKAYDLLVQSETGLVSLTGSPDEVAKAGIPVADIAAGMYAYSGILTALYRRATTGRISAVEVSLFDALAEWLASPAYYTRYGGRPPARVGAQHATIAPYGPFTTADNDTVLLAIQNEHEWHTFCQIVLDQPTLARDHRFTTNTARVEHRDELNALITTRFATLDTDSVLTLLDKANIANARMNTVAQFLDHPALAGRDRWRTVATPGGDVQALLPPVTLTDTDPAMDPVPALGEHTDAILRDLGRTDADIAALRAAHVI